MGTAYRALDRAKAVPQTYEPHAKQMRQESEPSSRPSGLTGGTYVVARGTHRE